MARTHWWTGSPAAAWTITIDRSDTIFSKYVKGNEKAKQMRGILNS